MVKHIFSWLGYCYTHLKINQTFFLRKGNLVITYFAPFWKGKNYELQFSNTVKEWKKKVTTLWKISQKHKNKNKKRKHQKLKTKSSEWMRCKNKTKSCTNKQPKQHYRRKNAKSTFLAFAFYLTSQATAATRNNI